MEARRIDPDSADARSLVAAMEAEVASLYGWANPQWSAAARTLTAYVALYDGAGAVAGGALKELAPGVVEVKRMYVVPRARRRGLGRRLLAALEDEARALGFRVARLDTGDLQPHAEAMYRAAGYREVADYNGNRYASFWGEKAL